MGSQTVRHDWATFTWCTNQILKLDGEFEEIVFTESHLQLLLLIYQIDGQTNKNYRFGLTRTSIRQVKIIGIKCRSTGEILKHGKEVTINLHITYDSVMEKAMAPHSSTLAWKIPWMEEPGRLQSMGSLRVGHDWGTSLSLFTFMHWRRKWQPTPVFLPGESQGWGSLVAAIYGVTQSWTRLKWLSSRSIIA